MGDEFYDRVGSDVDENRERRVSICQRDDCQHPPTVLVVNRKTDNVCKVCQSYILAHSEGDNQQSGGMHDA